MVFRFFLSNTSWRDGLRKFESFEPLISTNTNATCNSEASCVSNRGHGISVGDTVWGEVFCRRMKKPNSLLEFGSVYISCRRCAVLQAGLRLPVCESRFRHAASSARIISTPSKRSRRGGLQTRRTARLSRLRTSEDHKLQRRSHRESFRSKLAERAGLEPRHSKGPELVRSKPEPDVDTFVSACLAGRSVGREHSMGLALGNKREPEQDNTWVQGRGHSTQELAGNKASGLVRNKPI